MKIIKLVLLIALVIASMAILFQNQASWQVHFLWLTTDVPAIILLLLTLAAGFVLGFVASFLVRRGNKGTFN